MNEQNIIDALAKTNLFRHCDQHVLKTLAQKTSIKNLNKGNVLFVNKDEAALFYVIVSGWVKLFRETLDGAQAVVDILPAEHTFGESSIFENNQYPYTAETAEPSTLLAIPLELLKNELQNNSNMALSMLSSMAEYRKQQDKELEHRTIQNAPQRIGCFLLRLIDQNAKGSITIHLPYDKTLVAARLGMQPETFSRALSKLKTAVGLDVKGASIHIKNIQDLSSYACSACTSAFPCKDLQTEK